MTGTLFGRARGHWWAQFRFGAPKQGSELHRIAWASEKSLPVQRLQKPWVGRVPRFTCTACRKRGAYVRPDFSWNKQPVAMMGYR
jgi:hypothetical protein